MRKALIVGIDNYPVIGNLAGCVNDAYSVKSVIERHADGTTNFPAPRMLIAGGSESVTRGQLKSAIVELYADASEIAFFYFAGHGFVDEAGGWLCTSDTDDNNDGLSFQDVISVASASPAKNKVLVLDCCFSGEIGNRPNDPRVAVVRDGMTILTASKRNQPSKEVAGQGVFTTLFVDALNGAAANLLGEVTPGSIYAHIDQSLGPWEQRPVFKTNVENFVSLRKADAPIDLATLQRIAEFFPDPTYQFPLDPSFEPERSTDQRNDPSVEDPDPRNVEIFRALQRLRAVNLVRPVGEDHMWNAAMSRKPCELTVLGEHYHRLVAKNLL